MGPKHILLFLLLVAFDVKLLLEKRVSTNYLWPNSHGLKSINSTYSGHRDK